MNNVMKKGLCVFGIILLVTGLASISVCQQTGAGRIADYVTEDEKSIGGYAPPLQWYIEKIEADASWEATGGGVNVVVAVLDTGIDAQHEDLAGRVIKGVNFTTSRTTADINGHGTLIAGIITASMENLKGATGIAYRSSLLNVKVAGDDGFVNPEAVAKGIVWAVDNGAQVINLSLTLSKPHPQVEEAVRYAWEKGAVIVAAAGNTAGNRPAYPAAFPNVIGVAATDRDDKMTRWTSRGDWAGVSAPGVDIYSTLPSDKYAYKNGTSYSAALVSGEAALLFAVATDRNQNGAVNDDIRNAIIDNTDTASRINVFKATKQLTAGK